MRFACLQTKGKNFADQERKKKRLVQAKKYVLWTKVQWDTEIFSDESKFNLHGSDSIWYVRRHKNKEFNPDNLSQTVKFAASQKHVSYKK